MGEIAEMDIDNWESGAGMGRYHSGKISPLAGIFSYIGKGSIEVKNEIIKRYAAEKGIEYAKRKPMYKIAVKIQADFNSFKEWYKENYHRNQQSKIDIYDNL